MSEDVYAQAEGGKDRKDKTIEERYQKKTLREHVLTRPDSYVGSCKRHEDELWVHDGEKMVFKTVSIVPALYKIFDEILVNAADNKVNDPSMDEIRVVIDVDACRISVWNNGDGIPVEIHQEHDVYVPEMIFGQLLTSDNYDDEEEKITGGRNGYGAKLTNIYSKKFIIETCDNSRMKRYKQTFGNNMTTRSEPTITECKKKESWTKVTFEPDLSKFKMTHLEHDVVCLMRKRVYDMAGVLASSKLKVSFNGERIKIKNFQDYVDLYLGPKTGDNPRVYERFNDRWEICIAPTDGQFQQVTFVNSICTSKGGKHVDYIVKQIAEKLIADVGKKTKTTGVLKPHHVRSHLWVFMNCQIRNPEFDSQTKENMTSNVSAFGSKCAITEDFIKKVKKSGLMDKLLEVVQFRGQQQLKKGDGKKKSRLSDIPKLEDANDAGSRNSKNCTLILTEGDSAKALAVAGLGVVGRDRYGVFPLRGKLLNVRDAPATQVSNNEEIQNLKKILGLQHGVTYRDVVDLRYGHVMIMADQDHDGSHIKGLVINFIHKFYPSLLKLRGFMQSFVTPVIKARKGGEVMAFYTVPEYIQWKETVDIKKWKVKYYKGLGTSTGKEGREYFAALAQNKKTFLHSGPTCDDSIDKAFSRSRTEDRKQWLGTYEPGTYLDHGQHEFTYSEFVDKELILFSRADVERSIPCVMDGLKPGQRKIMFCCFKRNLKASGQSIRVSQLAGYVSEHSAYHHGEQSLQSTIAGLAQNYWGSNNINLLYPEGQFGTRLQGGKDCASARYIYTKLSKPARSIFHGDDDQILEYLEEEGQSIEPKWYAPVVPMVLINGADGIGTGWSTNIPNFNPRELVANIKRMLDGLEPLKMTPWYKGFKGTIEQGGAPDDYTVAGTIARNENEDNMLEVTELPIKRWTQTYKEFLVALLDPKHGEPFLLDFKEYHTASTVHFELHITPEKMSELVQQSTFYKTFDLKTKAKTSNMVLFDADGKIMKYSSAEDILKDFFKVRLQCYIKRKAALLKAARWFLKKLNNMIRFILAIANDELVVNKRKRTDIEADLHRDGYDKLPSRASSTSQNDDEESESDASYNYLLSMSIHSLTYEKVQELTKEVEKQEEQVQWLQRVSEKELWISDLDKFMEALSDMEKEEEIEHSKEIQEFERSRVKGGRRGHDASTRSRGGGRVIRAASETTGTIMAPPGVRRGRGRGSRGGSTRGRGGKKDVSAPGRDGSGLQPGSNTDSLAARLARQLIASTASGAVSSKMDIDPNDIAEYVEKTISDGEDIDEVTSPLPKNLVAVAEGLMQKLKPKPKRKANVLLSSSSDDDVCEETEPQKRKVAKLSQQDDTNPLEPISEARAEHSRPNRALRRVPEKTYIDLRSSGDENDGASEASQGSGESGSEYTGSDSGLS